MSGVDADVAGAEEEFTGAYASIQKTSITTAPDRRVFLGRHFVFFFLSTVLLTIEFLVVKRSRILTHV